MKHDHVFKSFETQDLHNLHEFFLLLFKVDRRNKKEQRDNEFQKKLERKMISRKFNK